MPFTELRWRPRAMINYRLLVHCKWCKTEKKEKGEPSRLPCIEPGCHNLDSIRSRTCYSHYSTKSSRKGGDVLVLLISLPCSSIWIHKMAVYDIMAISWGAQTIGLIVGGRVDKGIQFVTYMASFTAVQKTVQKHFSNEMKIHLFIEDMHLPPKISKCISSHLITRTANEKPR
jgi:hypothetical protein